MLRRLHPEQPESFAFTTANQAWAETQMTKYPEGRQASAIIPLLWRAQEQEGWLSRAAIEHVADMLDMDYMRALEVATFYFMFQLQPVGSVAHLQICGTTSCMICGAEDLIDVCRKKIADRPHELSADGKFSWEEVECLGACTNAPMAQIGKDYYEDLTPEGLGKMIDEMASGDVPLPGPQNGRYAAEPKAGLTSLADHEAGRNPHNASVALAHDIGDSIKRIDGTEVPLTAPWQNGAGHGDVPAAAARPASAARRDDAAKAAAKDAAPKADGTAKPKAPAKAAKPAKPAAKPKPEPKAEAPVSSVAEAEPELLGAPKGEADDLKRIKGVGPQLEGVLNEMGFWHFWQIANWGAGEIAWVDSRIKFKGRIERDDWVSQAKDLANS